MGGADVLADGHPSMATVGLVGERLGWSGWARPSAKGTKQQQGRRSIVNTEPSVDTKPTPIAHRPPGGRFRRCTAHIHRFAQPRTCSEVEEAVSQHDHRRGEMKDVGHLMLRGGRSMVRERMYGDVWSRVARVDRWVELLRFRDVMSLIGCVRARVWARIQWPGSSAMQ